MLNFPWTRYINSHAQSYPTLCNPIDCSAPGCSVHGIFQARILEWDTISYPRGSSQPRDRTNIFCISCIGRQIFFITEPPGKPKSTGLVSSNLGKAENSGKSLRRPNLPEQKPAKQEKKICLRSMGYKVTIS